MKKIQHPSKNQSAFLRAILLKTNWDRIKINHFSTKRWRRKTAVCLSGLKINLKIKSEENHSLNSSKKRLAKLKAKTQTMIDL